MCFENGLVSWDWEMHDKKGLYPCLRTGTMLTMTLQCCDEQTFFKILFLIMCFSVGVCVCGCMHMSADPCRSWRYQIP